MKIGKVLKSISTSTVLNISCNKMAKKTTHNLAIVLSCGTKLELDTSNLHTTEIIEVIKALKPKLTSLDIHGINLNGEAADDIADVLSHNAKLKKVDLIGCSLQETGAINIIKALMNISTLNVFNISCNEIIEKAADYVGVILSSNVKLQELDLSNTSFKTTGVV